MIYSSRTRPALPSDLLLGRRRAVVAGDLGRLEFEMDALRRDTSISRTSSGLAIAENAAPELDVEAVLELVDRIAANGYLKLKERPSDAP